MSTHPGSLLKELDLEAKQFLEFVDLAAELKRDRRAGIEIPRLGGRTLALLFQKNSTRTRCAFEVAAAQQGARTTFIGADGSHLGREESVADTARVLGRLYDGIAFRGFSQETVEQLDANAGVPVWNGLTDEWHPTQMLADVLTMSEHSLAPIEQIAFCYTGDGRNNVARSLLVTGALLGMDVRIAAPRELQPPADVITQAESLAAVSGAHVEVSDDLRSAAQGAQFVYTDVWVSMGEPVESWAERIELLRPFRVTPEVMNWAASGARFMHCLPSLHNRATELGAKLYAQFGLDGLEVSDAVFESPAAVVFDQAENRMHTIKAVLVAALAG
jgi:ornithine carbamoyltransferase